jgi:hypothetical protein
VPQTVLTLRGDEESACAHKLDDPQLPRKAPVELTADPAAMSGPPRVVTEGVRDDEASSARRDKRRRREEARGGADDRGSARTARRHTRDRSRPNTSSTLRGHVVRRLLPSSKLELRRQAKLHLVVGSSASDGEAPRLSAVGRPSWAPRVGRHAVVTRRKTERGRVQPGIGQSAGARDGSRLQKSVRRIFLAHRAGRDAGNGEGAHRSAG